MAWVMLLAPALSWAGVVVTLPPLGGLVRMLDTQAEVTVLLPPTADPHHFQMPPKATESLMQATLFIRASRDDGGWSGLETPATTLDLWPDASHGWTRPDRVRAALPRLAAALERIYPSHAASIRTRLPAAIAETRRIEAAWQKALAPYHNDGVIMQHPSWQPLCELMGVPVRAVLESHRHGQEFGPRDLDRALQIVDAHPNVLLIAEARHDNRALDWIVGHSDQPLHRITLDALGTNSMRWNDLMQDNLKRLQP
ncbi:MAG TPA: zinc ABC transporter substrate-binding protein [Mariprofundaceae bacterium]|nr:zinc ABC transporter substrate-binding protein [Mariprofundaceae bacterium]